ncbi:MAG: hypothetical protein ACI9VR_004682, partial [Cognaticolwellia sp.]
AGHADAGHADAGHADAGHADAGLAGHSAAKGLSLELNAGARWALDAHTREVLAESRSSLKGELTSVEQANGLAQTLTEQQNRLIRGCTMDGQPHDVLHGFLEAWIPGVKALGQAKTLPEGQAQVLVLQSYLLEAERVFE